MAKIAPHFVLVLFNIVMRYEVNASVTAGVTNEAASFRLFWKLSKSPMMKQDLEEVQQDPTSEKSVKLIKEPSAAVVIFNANVGWTAFARRVQFWL